MSEPIWTTEPTTGDVICQHSTAADVHCCNCHSGFIFDDDHVCPEPESPQIAETPHE